ncbi:glycoside hydrolase family 28 protein [Parabacteroides sp. FAFU027]|uniref:glycoside hydrolase family 28 protein n=1 Tax=Parabacteroides sp. FAFU027 TaxID=2922715 RepID=UPI001FAFFD6A|nr:glycoside hydrolase family 28 protein [Parabacteroides sp. FAFU027]
MKHKFSLLALALLLLPCIPAWAAGSPWDDMKTLEASIERTSFPKADFNIVSFGAVANRPDKLCTKAINTAILTCSSKGGGRVIVPKGVFYTGGITLKSNVNLYLAEGAILRFSTNQKDYLPTVLTRWEGMDCYNIQPLLYAYNESNIAVTGKGTIDGQGSMEHWWPMCGAVKFGWKEGIISQRTGRPKLQKAEQSMTPVEQRVMTLEDGMRPQMFSPYKCNKVLVEGVTFIRAPFWVMHPLMCENVVVSGVRVQNHGPNGDGCDPESCNKVLIEKCYFETGDDCIAIKSGRNNDGRKWNMPSQNMIVRDCEMKDGHGGVVIGSEISGGYKNLYVDNCKMDSPNLERVIRIKTSTCRGGTIENVFVRNVTVGQCRECVLKIDLLYENREQCRRDFPPTVRNVFMENVTCQKSDYGVSIDGLPDLTNVYNINVKDCKFNGVKHGNKVTGAKDVKFTDLFINGQRSDQ